MQSISTTDALVIGGSALLLHYIGPGWSASSTPIAERRYRIVVVRSPWPGGGDGEFAARFNSEALRLASEKGCKGFRVRTYTERYEVSHVFFTHRVGEGEIECLAPDVQRAAAPPYIESPIAVETLPDTAESYPLQGVLPSTP